MKAYCTSSVNGSILTWSLRNMYFYNNLLFQYLTIHRNIVESKSVGSYLYTFQKQKTIF